MFSGTLVIHSWLRETQCQIGAATRVPTPWARRKYVPVDSSKTSLFLKAQGAGTRITSQVRWIAMS